MNIETSLEKIIVDAIVNEFKFITRNDISETELIRMAQATAMDIKTTINKELL